MEFRRSIQRGPIVISSRYAPARTAAPRRVYRRIPRMKYCY